MKIFQFLSSHEKIFSLNAFNMFSIRNRLEKYVEIILRKFLLFFYPFSLILGLITFPVVRSSLKAMFVVCSVFRIIWERYLFALLGIGH